MLSGAFLAGFRFAMSYLEHKYTDKILALECQVRIKGTYKHIKDRFK